MKIKRGGGKVTFATSRGLTRMAEITAAPAAEIALSPKPKLTSVKLLECEGESPPETATFLSNSTVVLVAVAAPIHEDNPCFVGDDPTIKNCIFV